MFDWFTVGAQLLNFLILIWLMKRFLYQPILNALDRREQKITAEINAANQKMQDAETERNEFVLKNQAFEQQRAELIKVATEEAKNERQQLLLAARQEADSLRIKHREALKNEQQNLIVAISQRTQHEVFAIARKILADLANANLEKQMIAVFIQKLQQTDSETQLLLNAIKNSTSPLLICTAFNLLPAQMAEIEHAIQTLLTSEIPFQFKTSTNLLVGIELSCNGQKISWSITDYLATLEKNLNELLQPYAKDTPPLVSQRESIAKVDNHDHS